MNIRRTARQAALTFAVVILPLVLACGDDGGTGTNETTLIGSWRVTSIKVDGVEILVGTSATLIVTMRSDGTYSNSVSGDTDQLFCEGTTSCTEDGTYVYTNVNLTFCDPGCDEAGQYTISGDTLNYVLLDVDAGVTVAFTMVRI